MYSLINMKRFSEWNSWNSLTSSFSCIQTGKLTPAVRETYIYVCIYLYIYTSCMLWCTGLGSRQDSGLDSRQDSGLDSRQDYSGMHFLLKIYKWCIEHFSLKSVFKLFFYTIYKDKMHLIFKKIYISCKNIEKFRLYWHFLNSKEKYVSDSVTHVSKRDGMATCIMICLVTVQSNAYTFFKTTVFLMYTSPMSWKCFKYLIYIYFIKKLFPD